MTSPISLSFRPSLEFLRKQAKEFLRKHRTGNTSVCTILRHLNRFASLPEEQILSAPVSLQEIEERRGRFAKGVNARIAEFALSF